MPRILVVGRDGSARTVLALELCAEGFTTVFADAATALGIVPAGLVDLVLLDDGFPEPVSRAVLAAALRCTPTLPVIVLADHHDLRSLVDALECGAADYLSRPFRFDELAARIRRSLRIADAGGRRLAG